MKFSHLEFKEVKGVGSIKVDFTPDKRVHAFIGENGVGKTKFLEALFQFFMLQSSDFKNNKINSIPGYFGDTENYTSEIVTILESSLMEDAGIFSDYLVDHTNNLPLHSDPLVYIGVQNRGFIQNKNKQKIKNIAGFSKRRREYIELLCSGMGEDLSQINMSIDIEQWFISIAQSSNPFQKKQDNREIEIRTVLKLCHQIDRSIDPEFMEIGGNNRVFLKVNDQKTQLSHLSTGYASILKIIQSIVSGYGYFTNEQQLQHVRGIVLIDEIESHLHLSWQSKIIPTLKELFPNTTFYITTHSPIVLTQLENGEAYRLQREEDGVVRSALIKHPSNSAFVDMLDDAFGLDVNEIKLQLVSSDGQKKAKKRLLDFANKQREASAK